jgi:hypothetical protein
MAALSRYVLSQAKLHPHVINGFVGLLSIWILAHEYPAFVRYQTSSSNECYTTELTKCYEWIRANADPEVIIECNKPTVVRLFTGHNCILSDEAFFKNSRAEILFLPKYLAPEWQGSKLLFDSGQYVVLGK